MEEFRTLGKKRTVEIKISSYGIPQPSHGQLWEIKPSFVDSANYIEQI